MTMSAQPNEIEWKDFIFQVTGSLEKYFILERILG